MPHLQKHVWVDAGVLLLMLVCAAFAHWIAPHDPLEQDLLSSTRLEALTLDITNSEQVDAVRAHCGDVTLLVNNAGINHGQGLISAKSLNCAQAEMATNYFGTLAMCRASAPQLTKRGAIVNVLSILAELAAQGTHVMAVMTGPVDTDTSRDFQGEKSSVAKVANEVIGGLRRDDEEVHHGHMATWINSLIGSDPKGLERELAKYLPG